MVRKYTLLTVEANNLTFPTAYHCFRLDAGYTLEQRIRKGGTVRRIDVKLVRKEN